MVADHIASGAGGDGGRRSASRWRRPTSSASSRSARTAGRSRRSGRSRPTRSACPTRRTRSTRRWATTSSPPTRWCEALSQDAKDHRPASTTWAATSSRCSSTAARRNVYDFRDNEVPGSTDRDRGYWRDVGTLDSFYDAHMDLIAIHPVFNLYNYDWPIYTENRPWPPAKFVHGFQRAARPGDRLDGLARRGHLRLAGGELGRLAERAGPLVGARGGLGADGGRRHRPARGGPQRDPRQERDRARGHRDRRRPGARPRSATRSPTPASS